MLNELLIAIGFVISLFFIVEILPDILSKIFKKDHKNNKHHEKINKHLLKTLF